MKYTTLFVGAVMLSIALPALAAENDDLLTAVSAVPTDVSMDAEYEVDDSIELVLDEEITKIAGPGTGETHKSEVAKAIADLLDTADLDRGIGDQVRMLAKEQESIHSDVADEMERIEERGEWSTFFWGPDYESIGKVRSALISSENGLNVLRKAKEKAHTTLQDDIDAQIVALEDEIEHARDYIDTREDVFSLFGWFAKWF
jgi:hypothetical protein